MNKQELISAIEHLKKEKNAIILAHYYVDSDIQDICDFLGDSLELAKRAASTDADIIVFCGVHFMAETAAILAPRQKVLIPTLGAGCSLADGVSGEDLRKWKSSHPEGVVISYVNTTADVKAETDICCTSANAVKVAQSIPQGKPILFVPDYHLGHYINQVAGLDMEIWDGNCCVHKKISSEMVKSMLAKYPQAEVLIHPESECSLSEEIINHPRCFFYSTSGIIRHAMHSDRKEFIIATENGVIHQLQKRCPDKKFIPISDLTICQWMKLCNLQNLYESLLYERYHVSVPEEIAKKALIPIQRMIALN